MAERNLNYQDLMEIIRLVEDSPQFSEFSLQYGDIKIDLRKNSATSQPRSFQRYGNLERAPLPVQSAEVSAEVSAQVSAPLKSVSKKMMVAPAGLVGIKAPMVGSFYRCPEPGAPPFIEIGAAVGIDTVVCIIEVMKLMNSLPAGIDGVVSEILVADGEPVEYGQILILIKPNA